MKEKRNNRLKRKEEKVRERGSEGEIREAFIVDEKKQWNGERVEPALE